MNHRYNIFNHVHKGLRALLYETALLLQRTDFGDPSEPIFSLNQAEIMLQLFDSHSATEDEFIMPVISRHNNEVIEQFEEEHKFETGLTSGLRDLILHYYTLVTPGQKRFAGEKINGQFGELMIFNLVHMAKEESRLNTILWQHYSDEEIIAISRLMIERTGPRKTAHFNKWIMRGISNEEIILWLSEVKIGAPDFVFNSLLETAESELSESRWSRIREALADGVVF